MTRQNALYLAICRFNPFRAGTIQYVLQGIKSSCKTCFRKRLLLFAILLLNGCIPVSFQPPLSTFPIDSNDLATDVISHTVEIKPTLPATHQNPPNLLSPTTLATIDPTQIPIASGPLATAQAMKNQASFVTPQAKELPLAWVTWIRNNMHPIVTTSGEDDQDLEILKTLVGDARIVQLGENKHLIEDYENTNIRIIKYLHEEMGFDLVGVEFPVFPTYFGYQQYAWNGEWTAERASFGFHKLQALFEYAKSTEESIRPLHVIGLHVYASPNLVPLNEHSTFLKNVVSQVDEDYGVDVYELDKRVMDFIESNEAAIAALDDPSVAVALGEEGKEWIDGYGRVIQFLDDHLVELQDAYSYRPEIPFMARQVAYAAQQDLQKYYASQTSSIANGEALDEGMAANVFYFLDQAYPGSKMVTWAHNDHILENGSNFGRINFGWFLDDRYGNEVYTIGLFDGETPRNEVIELFHQAGEPLFLIDLLHQSKETGNEWLFRTQPMAPSDRLNVGLRNSYDAILYFDQISLPDLK